MNQQTNSLVARWRELRVPWGTLVALALLGAFGLYEARRMQPAEAAPLASKPNTKQRSGVFAEGRLVTVPGSELTLAAERGGRITALHATEQDAVQANQVLVEFDSSEEEAALVEARARLHEATEQLSYAARELARSAELHARGVETSARHDEAAHTESAARARVGTLWAGVLRLKAALVKAQVSSPISGAVTDQYADEGEVVGPGAPLFTVIDFARLRVEVEVGEFDIARVRLHAPATISAEGFSQTWPGEVVEIPASVTSRRLKPLDPGRPTDTRILAVKVSLPSAHPLKLGQRVEVEIRE